MGRFVLQFWCPVGAPARLHRRVVLFLLSPPKKMAQVRDWAAANEYGDDGEAKRAVVEKQLWTWNVCVQNGAPNPL